VSKGKREREKKERERERRGGGGGGGGVFFGSCSFERPERQKERAPQPKR